MPTSNKSIARLISKPGLFLSHLAEPDQTIIHASYPFRPESLEQRRRVGPAAFNLPWRLLQGQHSSCRQETYCSFCISGRTFSRASCMLSLFRHLTLFLLWP